MDNQTFRSRLVELIQKSRKAMRLYTTVGRNFVRPTEYKVSENPRANDGRMAEMRVADARGATEFAELQASEWRSINADLVKRLSVSVESPNGKKLLSDVCAFREQLYSDFRMAEAELRSKQQDLLFAAENSDFIKAALLSRDLVCLKARAQATQAAHHELDAVMRRSKVAGASVEKIDQDMSIELSHDQVIEDGLSEAAPSKGTRLAKVIPLRKSVGC